jgi:hypothetical protein
MSKQAKPQRLTVFLFASPLMRVIKSVVSQKKGMKFHSAKAWLTNHPNRQRRPLSKAKRWSQPPPATRAKRVPDQALHSTREERSES